ncbi:MAG: transglycosylase [Betaproteobacteria bacterium]|nr:transglycosylase [Betaproteobacteria bacterium]
MTPRTFLVFAVFVAFVRPLHAAEDDALFLSAREAYQQGDAERLNRLATSLQDHLLWPYIAYWQFKAGPGERSFDEWREFLEKQPEGLTTQRARGDLIRATAKKADWEAVEREFATFELDDPDVRCLNTRARIERKNAEVISEAKQMWAQPAVIGDSCTELFEYMMRERHLSESDLWIRIRAELETNNSSAATHLFNYLPASSRPAKRQWETLVRNPHKYIQQKPLKLKNRTDREMAGFALFRMALTLPELAHERWQQIKGKFPQDEQAYVWAQLGAAGGFKHRPQALKWFRQAGGAPLTERQFAWKVRASIRGGDWESIAATIDSMPEKDRQISTWRYWRARAYLQEGKTSEAHALLAPLSAEHNFYGLLAADELGITVSGLPEAPEISSYDLHTAAQNQGLRRALKLFELDLRYEAVLEWRWSIRRMDDRQLLAVAELARRAGWYDRTIDTAERTKLTHDFRLRFPLPYRDVFSAYSQRHGIDEAWVYGLSRQESRFAPQVRSSAGAMGLMQLMPSTASQVARRLGLGRIDRTAITTVDTNVSLGTYHLRELLDMLDDKPLLASAAYNAGMSRARDWQSSRAMEGAVYAETIPFSETRDYVKKVMNNTMQYARVLGHPFVALKSRLGTIAGRMAGSN